MLTPFGKAIRTLRLQKGWRLLDLAQCMGKTPAFLSAVETGRKPIPDGFVRAVANAMDLSAEEIRELRRAADRTRKEVRVAALHEEQRELVAAFARRLDEIPDDLIADLKKIVLKSYIFESPFARKRAGIVVPPRSAVELRGLAEKVRSAFVEDDRVAFPIMDVLESRMHKLFKDFYLDVVEEEVMGDDEGRVIPGQDTIALRNDVYIAAWKGNGRARFTACHELAHFLLHKDIPFARARDDSIEIFRDSEWQADTFAGALLMSSRHLRKFKDSDDAAVQCGMSFAAAEYQWSIYERNQWR